MKKFMICAIMMAAVLCFAGCGSGKKTGEADQKKSEETAEAAAQDEQKGGDETEAAGWSREGFYTDENDNMVTITWMDDTDETGWYVGCMLGEDPMEDSWGGFLKEEGNTLHGALPSSGDGEDLTVTISEEGEDGIQLALDGGETYHFTLMDDMGEANIIVTISTEGMGNIDYAEGEEAPEIDKDFSTDAQITVLLDESADFVAVFEEDADWQNPVMNFVGEYQCDRAHATVQCFGNDEALITIEWAGSAAELARWDITGRLDPETLTIEYTGCTKSHVVYNENGDVESQEPEYEDGTGTIVFNDDGSFTWHEDQSETGEDMVFEWLEFEAQ